MSVSSLLCATLICALVGTAQSQRGYCDERGCWIGYRGSMDYRRGQARCSVVNAFMIPITGGFEHIPFGVKSDTGLDWRGMTDRRNETNACVIISKTPSGTASISVKECGKKLDGVVCYFEVRDPCRPLQVNKELPVTYRGFTGFVFENSKVVPTKTLAFRGKDGADHADSKHLCSSGKWVKAPWNCAIHEGGCTHTCKQENQTFTCSCPAGKSLHPNNYTCVDDPCTGCAHFCRQSAMCACRLGYRLGQDGKSCQDVDECRELGGQLCALARGEECWNTDGGYRCLCRDGFGREDGVCVNMSICDRCEHMMCNKTRGVYACQCRDGFRVSSRDPTKCVRDCGESCMAECIYDPKVTELDRQDCMCPDGYIKDYNITHNITLCVDLNECEMGRCDHYCENNLGGYRCSCKEGFELHGKEICKRIPKKKEEEEKDKNEVEGPHGLGSHSSPTWAAPLESNLPQYIRTGSILGISVFLALCTVSVIFLVWKLFRRCSSFSLPSLSEQDINLFYLQQVTTETYKRLSFDRQSVVSNWQYPSS